MDLTTVFLKLLNMSIAASWLILAVILLRLVLKRAPKWIFCALWAMVGVRLICPVFIESEWSMIPSAETFEAHNIRYETPQVNTGIDSLNDVVNPTLGEAFAPEPGASVNPLDARMFIAGAVWLVGLAALLLYAAVSSLLLRLRVRDSALLRENIRIGDTVSSPFIMGMLRPRIYLPSGMAKEQMFHVIAHERAHLARRDHWWKPLGFVLLAVYWFNPFCWAAYLLLCRDIELACDEKVIGMMDMEAKKAYSHALVTCASRRRSVLVCPLAFGEVGVRVRVKTVLNYRRPPAWIIAASVIGCVAAAVLFLTNPVQAHDHISGGGRLSRGSSGEGAGGKDGVGEIFELGAFKELGMDAALSEEDAARDTKEVEPAGSDTEKTLTDLIETICSSPAYSSNPGDYIKEHADAYLKLVDGGADTLRYCYLRFEKGGETGLKGQIMAKACMDIAVSYGEGPLVFNLPSNGQLGGQQWYSAFRHRALELQEQYSAQEIEEKYPASCLLLNMFGEM